MTACSSDAAGLFMTSRSGDHCVVGDGVYPPAAEKQRQLFFVCQ